MSVTIRAAVVTDAPLFAAALRPDDRREAEASGLSAVRVIQLGIGMSAQVFCALDGEEPLAIWGYTQTSIMDDVAGVWLLTCTAMERYRKAFVRTSRAQIRIWQDAGLTLTGMVDQRHAGAMRWLAREGFAIERRVAIVGPERLKFHKFERLS